MSNFTGPTAPDDSAQWQKHLAGKRLSSWPIFCYAVAGNLALATEKLSQVLQRFREATGRGDLDSKKAAIVFMDAQIQYNALIIGPLLGAIVLSVFAIESFLWLVVSCRLREKCDDTEVDAKLAELDRMSLSNRLNAVLDLIGVSRLPSDLTETIKELAEYRNLCAHDTPQVYGNAFGQMFKFKKGTTTPTPDQRFPLPSDVSLPLSLGDALLAAKTHDRLVQWISEAVGEDLERHHLLGREWLILKQLQLVQLSLDQIQRIDDAWDREVRAFVANVSAEQLQRFHNDLWGESGFFRQSRSD